MVSVKATASGTVSDMPVVRGLGPREEPIGIDVVLNVTGALFMNGLFLPDGLAGNYNSITVIGAIIKDTMLVHFLNLFFFFYFNKIPN